MIRSVCLSPDRRVATQPEGTGTYEIDELVHEVLGSWQVSRTPQVLA